MTKKAAGQQASQTNSVCFEEALGKLELIVKELEGGELPLEEALTRFAAGVELSQVCLEKLNRAETAIDKIIREDKGRLVEQPLVLGEEE